MRLRRPQASWWHFEVRFCFFVNLRCGHCSGGASLSIHTVAHFSLKSLLLKTRSQAPRCEAPGSAAARMKPVGDSLSGRKR